MGKFVFLFALVAMSCISGAFDVHEFYEKQWAQNGITSDTTGDAQEPAEQVQESSVEDSVDQLDPAEVIPEFIQESFLGREENLQNIIKG